MDGPLPPPPMALPAGWEARKDPQSPQGQSPTAQIVQVRNLQVDLLKGLQIGLLIGLPLDLDE
jgi:hypothetical protein